ncbi:MAG: hypothetical protein ACRC6D_00910 [Aeromonas sp.]
MEKHLRNTERILKNGRNRAYISRVAWCDLYKLVKCTLEQLDDLDLQKDEIGKLYLYDTIQHAPFNKKQFSSSNVLNQMQISTGWRYLNVSKLNSDGCASEVLMESGATLNYSQNITGAVSVMVLPYRSEAMTVREKNIIIARYNCPTEIQKKHIVRHFSTFFKYCEVTSANGNLGLRGYMYRLYLLFNDVRNKNKLYNEIFNSVRIAGGVAVIFVTLYSFFCT